jgi:transposase
MDTDHNAITEPVRRLEVFTGAGRRRTWRDEDKARIVAEIATSGDSVCAVARRQLRESEAGRSGADGLQFVPAVVDVGSQRRLPRGKGEASAGAIEVEIDGVTVRVGRGADAKTLMTVLRALKAGA